MAMGTKLALISFFLLLLTFILPASTMNPTTHRTDELISTKSTFPRSARLAQSNTKEQVITKHMGRTSTQMNDSDESLRQQEKRSHSRKLMAFFHDSKTEISTTVISVLVNYVKHYMSTPPPDMPSTTTPLSASSLPSSTSSSSLIKRKASKADHPFRRALTEKTKAQEEAPTHQELIPHSTQGQGTHGNPHATVDESSAFHVDYSGPKTHPPKNN